MIKLDETIDDLFAGPRYQGTASLRVRIVLALKANGIETLGQLAGLSRHELSRMPHLGPSCLREIDRTLQAEAT